MEEKSGDIVLNLLHQQSKARNAIAEFIDTVFTKNNHNIENHDVYKIIAYCLDNVDVCKTTINTGTLLFRARKIADCDLREHNNGIKISSLKINDCTYLTFEGFNAINSKEPILSIPNEGRNNIAGVSYLYLAEDPYTACVEIRPDHHEFISVAKFTVKRKLSIIDFIKAKNDKSMKEKLNLSVDELMGYVASLFSTYIKPENRADYFITQYIADLVQKAGYDGLAYRSSHTQSKCITLFHTHKKYIKFNNSKIFANAFTKHSFLALRTPNDKEEIYPAPSNDYYDNECKLKVTNEMNECLFDVAEAEMLV